MPKRSASKFGEWDWLIRLAKTKADRMRVKTAQLEAIIADFQRKAKAGEPCPTQVAGLKDDLSKFLQ